MRKLSFPMKLLSVLLCFIIHLSSFAQDRVITGTIRQADGSPVEGATIKVIGSKANAMSNAKGVFTIKASKGQTLEISFVGFESQRIVIGDKDNLSITLKEGSKDLDDVVVVAMDLKRNPKELGFSVAKVAGNEIQETQRENFLNGLQGSWLNSKPNRWGCRCIFKHCITWV
jgi:hypothetical protein